MSRNRLGGSTLNKLVKLAAVLSCLVLGTVANAHNVLKASSPANGATLASAPTELALTFNGSVRLVKFELHRAAVAVDVDFSPNLTAATSFTIPLSGLNEGAYSAKFSVIGEDGHTVAGHVDFGVGSAPAADSH